MAHILKVLLFSCLLHLQLYSQTWEKSINLPPDIGSTSNAVDFYPGVGSIHISHKQFNNHYAISFRANGDTAWTKRIRFDTAGYGAYSMYVLGKIKVNGNRFIIGTAAQAMIQQLPDYNKIFVLRYDSSGNLLHNYYVPCQYIPSSPNHLNFFPALNNSSYLVYAEDSTVQTQFAPNALFDVRTIHYAECRALNGTVLWRKRIHLDSLNSWTSGLSMIYPGPSITLKDRALLYSFSTDHPSITGRITKVDSLGNQSFSFRMKDAYNTPDTFYIGTISPTRDTGFVVLSFRNNKSTCLTKFNKNGVLTDSTSYIFNQFNMNGVEPFNIVQTSTGNYFLTYAVFPVPGGAPIAGVIKLNSNLNLVSMTPLPFNYFRADVYNLTANNLGGFYTAYGNNPFHLVNCDSLLNTYPNKITGVLSTDLNKNCALEASDKKLTYRYLSCVSNQSLTYSGYTNPQGSYTISVPAGSYTLNRNTDGYRAKECPASNITFTCSNAPSIIQQDHFDTIIPNISDAKISVFNKCFAPGFSGQVYVNYQNVGTTNINTTVKIKLGNAGTYSVSVPAPSMQNADTLIYTFNNLAPDSSGCFPILLNVNPVLNIGDPVLVKGFISTVNDFDLSNNTDSIADAFIGVLAKYSANASSPGYFNHITVNKPQLTSGNSEFVYAIFFQNNSGKTAKDVFILDSLSSYHDLSSLRIIHSSHPYQFSLIKGNQYFQFSFPNINLPDSAASFENSQGMIAFSLKAKPSWPLNNKLKNKAYVTFGTNKLSGTNTVWNLRSIDVGIKEEMSTGQTIHIFPNPAQNKVTISSASPLKLSSYTIYSILAEVVYRGDIEVLEGNAELDLSNLESGIYLIDLSVTGKNLTKKLIIQK